MSCRDIATEHFPVFHMRALGTRIKTIVDLVEDRIRRVLIFCTKGVCVNATAIMEPIETLLQKPELLNNNRLNNTAVMKFTKKLYGHQQISLRMTLNRGEE